MGWGWVVKNFFFKLGQNQIFRIWVIFFFFFFLGGGGGGAGAVWGITIIFGMNLLVGLKEGCILNLVEFGCVGAEKKLGWVVATNSLITFWNIWTP